MKKIAKKLLKALPVIVMICLVFAPVFAAGTNIEVPTGAPAGSTSSKIQYATGKVWATIITIVQILAVAAVVINGISYMVASADQKADIKKNLGTLTVGAVLVFCATTLIKFVVNSANQIL